MEAGIIGLGRMGMNMGKRLLEGGHQLVAFNRTASKTEELAEYGARACFSLEEMVANLQPPRIFWLMLPAGEVVETTFENLLPLLAPGDVVVDGGNTFYKEDLVRSEIGSRSGIRYVDVGTSGGIWGRELGYCLMVGGDLESFAMIEPLLQTLATEQGYLYCGPTGAGHFVKMIHNGIEYGMMQAYAEGFGLLEDSPYSQYLDYSSICHLWNQGSVIRSWLLEMAERVFSSDARLETIQGYVEDSGEGRWTVTQAIETGTSIPVLTMALMERFRSRQENSFSDRLLAALRQEFGGHLVKKVE
jgi:6-phosphogluconate dehydrogenase